MKTIDRRPLFESHLAKIPQGITDQNRNSPSGNPTAKNLFSIIHTLQEKEGVQLEVQASR